MISIRLLMRVAVSGFSFQIGSRHLRTNSVLIAFTDMGPIIGVQYFAMVFVHCCLYLAFFHSGDLATIY